MTLNRKLKCMGAAILVAATGCAAAPESGSAEETADQYTWSCTPDPGLPNVLIIGDSISIGYMQPVRRLLKGKANVYRPIEYVGDRPDYRGFYKPDKNGDVVENCGSTALGLQRINAWLSTGGNIKWDVIHFNWGLHDLKRVTKEQGQKSDDPAVPPEIPVEQYRKNLEQLVAIMQSTGAVLIFATTTPFVEGVLPCRIPEDAVCYNETALEVMKKHGVVVNDLYSAVLPRLEKLQLRTNVHFHPQGSEFLAEQVADRIEQHLPAHQIPVRKQEWIGCYGAEEIKTPNIDRMAANGEPGAQNRISRKGD
jgi:acyl-CoA thioesterase-1